MVWKKYSLEIELTGITRKRAAELLAEKFETTAAYSFEGSRYNVTDPRGREWAVLPCPSVRAEKWQNGRMAGANHLYQMKVCMPFLYENDFETVGDILHRLECAGAATNESTGMTVLLNMAGLESMEKFESNLGNICKSRGAVLQKAVGRHFERLADCSLLGEKGIVSLPLFPCSLDENAVRGYLQLSQCIADLAAKSKRIQHKENDSPNEKFLLRTWLVRIGFVGDEYKYARKLLTKNLSGNSAWLRKADMESQAEEMEMTAQPQEGQREILESPALEANSGMEPLTSPASGEEETETEEPSQYGITM